MDERQGLGPWGQHSEWGMCPMGLVEAVQEWACRVQQDRKGCCVVVGATQGQLPGLTDRGESRAES